MKPFGAFHPTPLTDSNRIDPERLAALIDGRLSDTEAAEVRNRLAAADEDTLAAFANAAAMVLDADAEQGVTAHAPAAVVPIQTRRATVRRRWIFPAVAAAAAALLGYVVWPRETFPPARYVAALSDGARPADSPVWGGTRAAESSIDGGVASVRSGALLTDLHLSAKRHAPTNDKVRSLMAVLSTTAGGAPLVASFGSFTNANTTLSPKALANLGERTAQLMEPRLFAVGAYLEAARLAAASGDTEFFEKFDPGPALDPLRTDQSLDAPKRSGLAAFDSASHARPRNAAALLSATTDLLRLLTQ